MSRFRGESFVEVGEADLSVYAEARAAEIDLIIAEPFRRGVIENLTALQAHARRMGAALQASDSASPSAVGERPEDGLGPPRTRRL